MKKFTRKTKGYNAQVMVARPIDITTDANLALFLSNAPLGEIGVYDGANALHTDAIGAAEEFYLVMKTTEGIKRTPNYVRSEVVVRRVNYRAPQRQVSHVGWNRTGGALGNVALAAGQTFGVKVIETTEGFDPFPNWYFEYTSKNADVLMDVVQALVKDINNTENIIYRSNAPLVTAKATAQATYGNYALGGTTPTLTVTKGSTRVTLGGTTPTFDAAVGDFIAFDGAATPSNSVGDIYKVVAISAGVSITLNRPYQGATQTFTQAEANGTRIKKVTSITNAGIEFTTIDTNVHFRLAVAGNFINADVSYTTQMIQGNGTYDQVLEIEKEGRIFAGETTNMVPQPEKWGQQDTFAAPGETYDFFHFEFLKSTPGIAPDASYHHRGNIVVAVARSAGNVDGTFNTLFGVS